MATSTILRSEDWEKWLNQYKQLPLIITIPAILTEPDIPDPQRISSRAAKDWTYQERKAYRVYILACPLVRSHLSRLEWHQLDEYASLEGPVSSLVVVLLTTGA